MHVCCIHRVCDLVYVYAYTRVCGCDAFMVCVVWCMYVHIHVVCVCSIINIQRELIALDRQGTQQQRFESTTITPPGVRVNTRYINSTKGTSSKKDAPSGMYTLHFRPTRRQRCVQAHSATKVCTGTRQNHCLFEPGHGP